MRDQFKLETIEMLASYLATSMKEVGMDLSPEDALGMGMAGIVASMMHVSEEDARVFKISLKEAYAHFQTILEMRAGIKKTGNPFDALASVAARLLSKEADLPKEERHKRIHSLQELLGDIVGSLDHKDCSKCPSPSCRPPRKTVEWFQARVGRIPTQDELRRANCGCAGEPRHATCGVCKDCDMPLLMCTCV